MSETSPPLPQAGYIAVLTANGYICRDTLSWTHRDCAKVFLRDHLEGVARDEYMKLVAENGGDIILVRLEMRE